MSESAIHHKTFFTHIPESVKELFGDDGSAWEPLKGALKESFSRKNKIEGEVSDQASLNGEGIIIEKGARVDAFSYIEGPCYIGSGTHVRPGAYLRGHVYVGQNCVVGHSTEIKHSLLMDGAKAGHFNYIGDSVLGAHVNLGAGTKIANLKVTPGEVVVKAQDTSIQTGLRKFGAILGEDCQTGCNSVLNPGTCLFPRSIVFPNVSASGLYTKKTLIRY